MSALLAFFFFSLSLYLVGRITKAAKTIVKLEAELKARTAQARAQEEQARDERARTQTEMESLNERVRALAKFQKVVDADAEAKRIIEAASQKQDTADARLANAANEASLIIEQAKKRADAIAGDAYKVIENVRQYERTAQALRNIIDGYGDAYLVPTYSLIDELAEDFGYTEAGAELKRAREHSRALVRTGVAARCEYTEENRRTSAVRFIIDAFNGKVDSILSRTKATNYGTLHQEILDSFALVNHLGTAFRNARVTEEYLNARLDELKSAVVAYELREKEREEQRRIREQIREEERARREYERAIKDAAKEEEALRKAMEKARQEVARATESERAGYEAKLAGLEIRLKEAEEKNQRALSMAQQTKTGHVYVISNVGSFGEEVFKIGMTRRLEPKDRIRELGDASVPFEFDVHALIWSEDAPGLERNLHRHFLKMQVNKVNPRKEFFRIALAEIRSELDLLGVQAHWTMAAEAREYRETRRIEEQMRANPEVSEDWVRHQMELDSVSAPESAEDAEVAT